MHWVQVQLLCEGNFIGTGMVGCERSLHFHHPSSLHRYLANYYKIMSVVSLFLLDISFPHNYGFIW